MRGTKSKRRRWQLEGAAEATKYILVYFDEMADIDIEKFIKDYKLLLDRELKEYEHDR